MASKVTQSDQNGSKVVQNGPKWVQNGPKWVQSVQNGSKTGQKGVQGGGGPKMGPPEVGTKKKSKNIFSLAPLWGLYRGPPSKTRSWEDPGHPDHVFAEFRKKVGKSPRRMVQREGFAHFFSDFGDRVGWVPGSS